MNFAAAEEEEEKELEKSPKAVKTETAQKGGKRNAVVAESDESDSESDCEDDIENTDDDDDDEDDIDSDNDGDEREENSDDDDGESDSENDEHTELKEDIYGRLKDAEGNVVEANKNTGSYVPPAKRLAMAGNVDQKKKLELDKISKRLKGLINR